MVQDISKSKYITNFVARAFFIAVLAFLILIGILLAVYFADLLVNRQTGRTDKPLFGAYVIVTPSMVPTIKVNDAIVIKRIDNDKYSIGDIITFDSPSPIYQGFTITHRIINKVSESSEISTYTTKGDNNSIADPNTITTASIHGKVFLKLPKLGYIKKFFSKPINFFIAIIIPALVLLLYDGSRIVSVYNKK
ncbi:MAG: signal peptidase I [Bacilli bacterium]|nr:signal peptidase I [Bacilli bacterium]